MEFSPIVFVSTLLICLYSAYGNPLPAIIACLGFWLWKRKKVERHTSKFLISSVSFLVLLILYVRFCGVLSFATSPLIIWGIYALVAIAIQCVLFLGCRLIPKKHQRSAAIAVLLAGLHCAYGLIFQSQWNGVASYPVRLLRSPFDAPVVVVQGGYPHGRLNHHYNWALDLIPLNSSGGRIPFKYAGNYFGSFNANSRAWSEDEYLLNVCFGMDIRLPIQHGIVVSTYQDYEDHPSKKSESDDLCGNSVLVRSQDDYGNYSLRFCHMKKGSIVVHAGQELELGTKLGACGHSGNSSTPHLHLEAFRTSEKNHAPLSVSEIDGPLSMRQRIFSESIIPQRGDILGER